MPRLSNLDIGDITGMRLWIQIPKIKIDQYHYNAIIIHKNATVLAGKNFNAAVGFTGGVSEHKIAIHDKVINKFF